MTANEGVCSKLLRRARQGLKLFLRETVPERNPIPGAVIAIQTFGDFLGFNPHCHVLVTDGCFYGRGDSKRNFSSQQNVKGGFI
jgi:hypothetical protein